MIFSEIWESLKPLEYFYGTNIDSLSGVYRTTNEKHRLLAELSKFCVMRPRLARLIDTHYYASKYAGNEIYDLVIASCCYGSGDLVGAKRAAQRHALATNDPFFPLLLSRIYGAMGETALQSSVRSNALLVFPSAPLVILSNAEQALIEGRIDAANKLLDKARPAVEEFLKDEIAAVATSAEDLQTAIRDGLLSRNEKFDVYDDELTRATWLSYFERFTTQNRYQSGDGFLIDYLDTALTHFCEQENIGAVVDFGSLCAEIIARPAGKLPSTRFVGIDRQEFVALMNREAYDFPNMTFESGDVIDYLPKFGALSGAKVFFHVRTACLLYPELVKKIYSVARLSGVEYIMLWEGDGLSRHHLRFFDFDSMPDISIARKGVLFNHNYKAILDHCGYKIIQYERLPSMAIYSDIGDLVGSSYFIIAKLSH